MTPDRALPSSWLLLLLLAPASVAQEAQRVGAFELHFDAEAFAGAEDVGREVFVAFGAQREPRMEMHGWFNAPPVMRFELDELEAGAVVTLDLGDAALFAPTDLPEAQPRSWKVQAIARLSPTGRQAGLGAGDVHSDVVEIEFAPGSGGAVALHLNRVVEERPFRETDRIREYTITSNVLSEFHGFEYPLRAGVLLPKEHDPEESYPVLYSVTGFGGTHDGIHGWARRIPEGSPLERCILVVPDANNRYGHSVFCDSRSIGPWGEALVHELIPALETELGGAGPEQRYVTGVSSGGWSSLWLQVAYPESFAGCWSHVPDPIDFHDFQGIDLYEPLPDGSPRNMYKDEAGRQRPVARMEGMEKLSYEDFVRRERVLNPGGQIRSFEGTFSPPLADGTPRRVFDRESGEIDHEAAELWRPYDISHLLLTRWEELEPSLTGKIHVYAGEVDTFYLEGAVERFRELAEEAGLLEHMVVEVVPDMAHSLHREGHEQMLATIEARAASSSASESSATK